MGHEVSLCTRQSVSDYPAEVGLGEALDRFRPDYVVICNDTASHHGALTHLAQSDFRGAVLVEKPLFDQPFDLPDHQFSRAAVGYNLRFHPVVRALRDIVAGSQTLSVTCQAGQYLPDWRPDTDYRDSYSASRAAGGGVLRDLSHELDYLMWMFGPWQRVTALVGTQNILKIETEETVSLMLTAKQCPMISVTLDYLHRPGVRFCRVQTEEATITADLLRGEITVNGETQTFPLDADDTYRALHEAMIGDGSDPVAPCSLEEGLATLELIVSAEQSASGAAWVEQ